MCNKPSVPKLLVSVRDVQEAYAALAGGADWIDLKEPSQGALAAVSVNMAQEVSAALAGRCSLSAALGELIDWPGQGADTLLQVDGIWVVKLGLAGCAAIDDWQLRWVSIANAAAATAKSLAAVVYADWQSARAPSPAEVLELATQCEAKYLLIDTHDKHAGTIFDHFSQHALHCLLIDAKTANLQTVVAGSITQKLLKHLPHEVVDVVAVRGAVCQEDRTTIVKTPLVKAFHEAVTSVIHGISTAHRTA